MQTTDNIGKVMNAKQKAAAKELHDMAMKLATVCTKLTRGFRDDGDDLRDIIAAQEKQHRKGSPTPYTMSVAVATDYFMVRIFAYALSRPEATASELDGMREDYIRASLLITRTTSDGRTARDMFAAECRGIYELSEKYEYPDLNVKGA